MEGIPTEITPVDLSLSEDIQKYMALIEYTIEEQKKVIELGILRREDLELNITI